MTFRNSTELNEKHTLLLILKFNSQEVFSLIQLKCCQNTCTASVAGI